MVTITRKLEFDYGHRVMGHEGRCKHIHGHRGVAKITVTANQLDSIGRIIDFGVIKTVVGKWIDDNWDHNLLLNFNDSLAVLWNDVYGSKALERKYAFALDVFDGKKPYMMRSGNPTAENMAEELFNVSSDLLKPYHIEVVKVRLYETPNSYADYDLISR